MATEHKLIAWPTATKNAYASLARRRRVSVNALINQALREWLEAERQRARAEASRW